MTPVAVKEKIQEARQRAFREGSPTTGQRREIVIIEAGWGSSGYYSEKVLERDIPRIFPVGSHMYLNHPTEKEDVERPERDVRDWVGVVTETPRMSGIASVAVAEIFEHWLPVIDGIGEHLGLSIRALGLSEYGSAGGRDGEIIEALTEGLSIDYVTLAGAGGKVGPLVESVRERIRPLFESARKESAPNVLEEARNAGNWLEAGIHRNFTETADRLFGEGHLTRDERIAMSMAIGDGLKAFSSTLESEAPQLFSRDPYADLEEPEEQYIAEKANGRSGDPKEEANSMAENEGLSELKEQFRQLKESTDSAVKAAEERAEKAEKRAEEAERREEARQEKDNKTLAVSTADKVLESVDNLPSAAKTRIIESVTSGDLPMRDGNLDTAVLEERTRVRLREEAEYLGESANIGKVSGAGGSGQQADSDSFFGESGDGGSGGSENADALVESFKRQGMSDEAAKIAARGR